MYVFHPHTGKLWTTTIVVNKVHYHSTLSVIGFIGSWILTYVIILSIKLWLLFAIAIIFTNMRPSIILINKRSFYWYNQVFQILHWVVWFGQSTITEQVCTEIQWVVLLFSSSICVVVDRFTHSVVHKTNNGPMVYNERFIA